jgi:hypothetical protein
MLDRMMEPQRQLLRRLAAWFQRLSWAQYRQDYQAAGCGEQREQQSGVEAQVAKDSQQRTQRKLEFYSKMPNFLPNSA